METQQKESEVLTQTEYKFTLSQEEMAHIVKLAAKEGIAAYKREQEENLMNRTEKVRNSAKLLIQHYRKLKRMKDTSIYDTDTITDPTLSEIFEHILNECRKGEFHLTSIKKNSITTGMIMNHVDVQLENYKRECSKSPIVEIQRRYRVVEMMFLKENSMKAVEVAEIENIDKSNIYRTLEKAYDDLATLFFCIEGLDVVEYRKRQRIKEHKKG